MKPKNLDETWNVYNMNDGYMTVSDDWLNGIPRRGIIELEIFYSNIGPELKVTYYTGEEVWYKNVFGSWGFPTVFRSDRPTGSGSPGERRK